MNIRELIECNDNINLYMGYASIPAVLFIIKVLRRKNEYTVKQLLILITHMDKFDGHHYTKI